MQKAMLVAFVLTFVNAQGLVVPEDKKLQETKAAIEDSLKLAGMDQLPGFPKWAMQDAANSRSVRLSKHGQGKVKKIVKKKVDVPDAPDEPEEVPANIEEISSFWHGYHPMNPTAQSLKWTVKEIVCSRYTTEWCLDPSTHDDPYASARASLEFEPTPAPAPAFANTGELSRNDDDEMLDKWAIGQKAVEEALAKQRAHAQQKIHSELAKEEAKAGRKRESMEARQEKREIEKKQHQQEKLEKQNIHEQIKEEMDRRMQKVHEQMQQQAEEDRKQKVHTDTDKELKKEIQKANHFRRQKEKKQAKKEANHLHHQQVLQKREKKHHKHDEYMNFVTKAERPVESVDNEEALL